MKNFGLQFLFVAAIAFTCIFAEDHQHEPSEYKFAYGVNDPRTGDNHEQYEISDGHVVKGAYTLKEADGTRRIVEYIAGPHSGYNAIVRRIGHGVHPTHYETTKEY